MPPRKPHHTSDTAYVNPIEDGRRYIIESRGLNIVWGNDSRYWSIPTDHGPAELVQVSWLEVSGVVTIKTSGKYRIQFKVKVKEDGFGWSGTEVLVMAKLGKRGQYAYKVVTLNPSGEVVTIPAINNNALEITVDDASPLQSRDLHFGLYEVWSGKWKGGLQIYNAEVVPVT